MVQLNEDLLFLILEELQYDGCSLCSSLLVNKTWCKIIIPILWKSPWRYLKFETLLLVIILHLSNETKETLRSLGINLLVTTQQKLTFNYIGFIRCLELYKIRKIIDYVEERMEQIEKFNSSIIRDEILELFINRNAKYTHLYIPLEFNYQIHLIPGAEHCFSELNLLYCSTDVVSQSILEGLAGICKTIRRLEFFAFNNSNNSNKSEIVKLIEVQGNLNEVIFTCYVDRTDESLSYCKTLEESLIKHADTIKFLQITWIPITKVLSHLVNLINLEIEGSYGTRNIYWSHLEGVSLPSLKFLKVRRISSKSLANLIKNTKGQLTEISIDYGDDDDKEHIQAIYQNCPNLKYLKLFLERGGFSELKELLINCKSIEGLVIKLEGKVGIDWDNLYEILTSSSPISLFKFKFYCNLYCSLKLKNLKLFLDNWEGRHPMLLQAPINLDIDFIEKYKEDGIIKNYDDIRSDEFEDFIWTQKKF